MLLTAVAAALAACQSPPRPEEGAGPGQISFVYNPEYDSPETIAGEANKWCQQQKGVAKLRSENKEWGYKFTRTEFNCVPPAAGKKK